MELRHLRSFLAVVRSGSFTVAAKQLGISQPPLSRQMLDLERELGFTLLVRGRNGARPTEAGAVFCDAVESLLVDLTDAAEQARSVASGKAGRIRIGYSHAAMTVLDSAIRALRAEGSAAWIDLHEMTAFEQVGALRANRIDLALGYKLPPLDAGGFRSQRLVHAPLRLVIPRAALKRAQATPSTLSELPLIFMPQATAPELHARLVARLRRLNINPVTVREARSVRSVLVLVSAGDGFGTIPDTIDISGFPGLARLDTPALDIDLDTWAFWSERSTLVERLISCAMKARRTRA